MATKVKSLKDGPLETSGAITVENAQGERKEFATDKQAWLCRCGASKNKPYCDGSHRRGGFQADK